MTRSQFLLATFACSFAASSIVAHADTRYRLTQIVPDSPAATISASDLNNRGQVIGGVQEVNGQQHAFAWRDGMLTNLGPLLDPTSTQSRATRNNDHGDIIGFYFHGAEFEFANFLLRRGEVTHIEGSPDQVLDLTGINDRRQIAVGAAAEDGSSQAFLWEDGNLMPLPPLPGDAGAQAIALNERGEVLGLSGGPAGHIVIWEDAQPRDLNIPGATPADFNDREQVVGTLQRQGFVWERGTVTSLPVFAGSVVTQAFSINNAGEIVGTSNLQTGPRATLWKDEQIFDLNDLVRSNDPVRSFVMLEGASSINDRGAIVATGRDSRFPAELRTYLLTPAH